MTAQTPTIGIDFGTSKSCMAWFNPKTGQAEVIMNAEGEHKTPSVVYFGDAEVLVGTPAEQMLEDEEARSRVVTSVKRDLVSAPRLSLGGGKRVKPVDVVAEVLRKLRHDAETGHFHQLVPKAVITCPAEFGQLARDAIAKAGQVAGFEEVALLDEPVAAGLAYQRAGLAVGDHVLVYDLGGGTFDLAVLMRDAEQGYRLALPPQGEMQCGGDDFDRALYDHLDEVVQSTLGRSIAPDDRFLDKAFLRECRQAKEGLTAREQTQVLAHLPGTSELFKHRLERAVFEELVRDRVETTVRLTETLLQQARASGCAVDTVVLIGGSARVPLVIKQLQAALPMPPQRWEKQDVAVALGAAYHAATRWGNGAAQKSAAAKLAAEKTAARKPAAEKAAAQKLAAEKAAPTVVTVATDGSGDYASLEKAMTAVAAGGTIRLLPGEHRLAKSLVVDKAVHLVGAGMDAATVVGYFEPQVVKVTARGRLQAEGITFRPSGAAPANVMETEAGELELAECRLTGGVADPKTAGTGTGLVIAGSVAAKISRCRIETNQGSGIVVRAQAQPTLEGNTCQGNKGAGIVYFDTAAGMARQNQCVGNELSGIDVEGQAKPTLEGNTCQGNKQVGIIYIGTSGGTACHNQCVGNEQSGIQVSGQAHPTLDGNICQGNKQVGIVYFGTSGGTARQNQCAGNELSGIQVSKQAQPALEGNTCQGNKVAGIYYNDTAAGSARKNQCVGNELSGIQVSKQAQPALEGNTCQGNKVAGIYYNDTAAGSARKNQCVGNEKSGISVEGQAQPTLEENTCQGNKYHGIAFADKAISVARQNQCMGNASNGIQVSGQAQPTLESNTCADNKSQGIVFSNTASGSARQNRCTGNASNGIRVQNQAQAILEGNTCQDNQGSGILYDDSASGTARQNQCVGNMKSGIQVGYSAEPGTAQNLAQGLNEWLGFNLDTSRKGRTGELAKPALEGNICQKNKVAGIIYYGNTAGVARQNQCMSSLNGISVREQAHPTLEDNTCKDNLVGIGWYDFASGTARNNRCMGNSVCGTLPTDRARPTLQGNTG